LENVHFSMGSYLELLPHSLKSVSFFFFKHSGIFI